MSRTVGSQRPRLDAVAAGALLTLLPACGGIRPVGGGGAWRSPQPTAAEIEFVVRELGVRTVVSLRGASPGKTWYDREREICERLGVRLVSLGWSARRLPDERVDALVDVFRTEPGPYLLHCRGGKNRSSLASAMYRWIVLGHTREHAEAELAFLPNGHLPIFGYEAIDEAWERFLVRHAESRLNGAGSRPSEGPEGRSRTRDDPSRGPSR